MKYILASLFLLCALSSYSQKFNTKIVVEVTDTTNIIKRVVDAFNEEGYTVDQQSEKFVSTKEKSIANKNVPPSEMKLKAFLKEGSLTFTGEFKINMNLFGQPPSFLQMENRGAKNSIYKVTWAEMEQMAKRFGTKITYSK